MNVSTVINRRLEITAAAVVLFAIAASLPAQSGWRADAPAGAYSTSRAAPIGDEGLAAGRGGDRDSMKSGGKVAPWRSWLLVPLSFYVLPVLILTVILTFRHLRVRTVHKTLRAMIERGLPVTPELVASLKPQSDPRGQKMCYLLPGLICSAVGIGLTINAGRAGLIPLLIGAAFLIAWRVEMRNTRAD